MTFYWGTHHLCSCFSMFRSSWLRGCPGTRPWPRPLSGLSREGCSVQCSCFQLSFPPRLRPDCAASSRGREPWTWRGRVRPRWARSARLSHRAGQPLAPPAGSCRGPALLQGHGCARVTPGGCGQAAREGGCHTCAGRSGKERKRAAGSRRGREAPRTFAHWQPRAGLAR